MFFWNEKDDYLPHRVCKKIYIRFLFMKWINEAQLNEALAARINGNKNLITYDGFSKKVFALSGIHFLLLSSSHYNSLSHSPSFSLLLSVFSLSLSLCHSIFSLSGLLFSIFFSLCIFSPIHFIFSTCFTFLASYLFLSIILNLPICNFLWLFFSLAFSLQLYLSHSFDNRDLAKQTKNQTYLEKAEGKKSFSKMFFFCILKLEWQQSDKLGFNH